MYKDIISYELADNISEAQLLQVAGRVVKQWMIDQPGFIVWEINKNEEGSYRDIVHWMTKEDAKKAELEMINIPNAAEWFACCKEGTVRSVGLEQIEIFKK